MKKLISEGKIVGASHVVAAAVVVLVSLPQDELLTSQHKYLSPKESYFQFLLMNIYDIVLKKNLMCNMTLNLYERALREKTC